MLPHLENNLHQILFSNPKLRGRGERGKKILLMRTALLAKINKVMELKIYLGNPALLGHPSCRRAAR